MRPAVLPPAVLLLAALLLAGLPLPAHALSCLRPDPVRDYVAARDADEVYSIVVGTLTAPGDVALPVDGGPPARSEAVLDGRVLGDDGLVRRWTGPVTVELTCAGPWCAGAPDETRAIWVLRHEGDGLTASFGPCAGPHPATDEAVDRLLACHLDGACDLPG